MYPYITIFGIPVYAFGLTITICFFLFLWMLKRLSLRFGYNFSFFKGNILYLFLSVFIFSRLFYVFSRRMDVSAIRNPFQFFIVDDYNFSLFGAMFGFMLIVFLFTRLEKIPVRKYLDGIVLAFLFILIPGFLGAFLGGQVYGAATNYGIEIVVNHPASMIPIQAPMFPLALFYSAAFLFVFPALYVLSHVRLPRGFVGYLGLIVFGAIILIGEFFSGKTDILSNYFESSVLHLTQIFAIILIVMSAIQLYRVTKLWEKENGSPIVNIQ